MHAGPAGQLLSAPPAEPRLPPWDIRNVLADERRKVLAGVSLSFSRKEPGKEPVTALDAAARLSLTAPAGAAVYASVLCTALSCIPFLGRGHHPALPALLAHPAVLAEYPAVHSLHPHAQPAV
eukprot:218699-Pelagomonas_calceolata.AAC.1